MHTPFTTVTNVHGRTFAVRYLPIGAKYGRNNTIVTQVHSAERGPAAVAPVQLPNSVV